MDYARQHPLAISIIAAGFVILTIVAFMLSSSSENSGKPTITNPLEGITFNSPISKVSDSLTVNYGGTSDPNQDSVQPPYRIFGLVDLPLSEGIRKMLPDYINRALWSTTVPTYATTYVQIDRSTLQCDTQYDCRFSFYLDSPESYYDFHLSATTTGSYVYTIKQQPLPGVSQ